MRRPTFVLIAPFDQPDESQDERSIIKGHLILAGGIVSHTRLGGAARIISISSSRNVAAAPTGVMKTVRWAMASNNNFIAKVIVRRQWSPVVDE